MKNLALKSITEAELINGCLTGQRNYQKMLYDTFSPTMFAICLRYAPDYHTAEDFLQEGFVKVFNNLHKYGGLGSFEGWMKRLFVNYAIEQLRRIDRKIGQEDIALAEDKAGGDNVMSQLNMEDITKLIQGLPNGYRTIFNLYVIEGFSSKEIVDMLHISEGTARSQLARARTMLKKMLLNAA
jgi:RNA polymerase sigma-70 factor (ECF subfamily)